MKKCEAGEIGNRIHEDKYTDFNYCPYCGEEL